MVLIALYLIKIFPKSAFITIPAHIQCRLYISWLATAAGKLRFFSWMGAATRTPNY